MASGYCEPVRPRADQTQEQYGLQLLAYLIEHGSPVASGFDDQQIVIARAAVGYAVRLKYDDTRIYARLAACADALAGVARVRATLTDQPVAPMGLISRLPVDDRPNLGPMAWRENPRSPSPVGPSGAPERVSINF